MKAMKVLDAIAEAISLVTAVLACITLALMAIHVSTDILVRYVTKISLGATLEIGTYYYMVSVAFLGLARAQRDGQHITVDIVAELLPRRAAEILTLGANVVFAAFVAIYLYASFLSAVANTRTGEYTIAARFLMPVWPARWILCVSLLSLLIVLIVQIVKQSILLGRNRSPDLQREAH